MAKSALKKSRRAGSFFPVHAEWMASPAYRALKAVSRALLFELLHLYRPIRNGRISLSVENAAKLLNCAPDTASRAFHELAEHGFIALTKGEFWQERLAREWRITVMECNGREPTDEWRNWTEGNPVVLLPKKNRKRSQNMGQDCPDLQGSLSKNVGQSQKISENLYGEG